MSKKSKRSKQIGSKKADTVSSPLDVVSVDHTIKTYLLPFPHAPICPIAVSLQRQELYQYMYVVDKFLLANECNEWITHAENIGFVEVFQASTSEYAHRENGRIQYDDSIVAKAIFQRLVPLLPPAIDGLSPYGCSSNIRLYRYQPGQRFGRHIDESHVCHEGATSKFTLLIYLNGDEGETENENEKASNICCTTHCSKRLIDKKRKTGVDNKTDSSNSNSNNSDGQNFTIFSEIEKDKDEGNKDEMKESKSEEEADIASLRGGATLFYSSMYGRNPVVSVPPIAGKLLLHGHGRRCLTHEGAEVISGVKYILRTDVLYK